MNEPSLAPPIPNTKIPLSFKQNEGRPHPPSPQELELLADQVRAMLAGEMNVDSVATTKNPATDGILVVRGQLLRPSHELFPGWLTKLNRLGYTPFLRPDPAGLTPEHVELRIAKGVAGGSTGKPWINLALFVATLASTLFVGATYGATEMPDSLLSPAFLIQGWPFALTLLGILTAHEFGHYFAARYHGVKVTLPYFIPMPLGFGTLGAFIAMREPISDRRKLFDIGVAGPLAGLVLAVPLLFVGLSASPMTDFAPGPNMMLEGNSLLYYFAKIAVFGRPLPDWTAGLDVLMNQVTFAAWIGLLVTALNLLPVGQLDGGHTVFALFGEKARLINRITLGLMAFFAVAGLSVVQDVIPVLEAVGFSGWFMWIGLIFFVIGPHHPPALDDVTRLDARRRWIGYFVILIFVVTFTPVPWRFFG